jgi:hypothetical protein
MLNITQVIHVSHELDMLEAHIIEAQKYAQRIVVKESECWWSGLPKPLYVMGNWSHFKRYNIEIMEIPTKVYDLSQPGTIPDDELAKWRQVNRNNRDATRYYGWKEVSDGATHVIESDVDEILDIRRMNELVDLMESSENYLHIAPRYQNFIRHMNRGGHKHTPYRVFRTGEKEIVLHVKGRHRRECQEMCGWHFSSCFKFAEELQMKAIGICCEFGYKGVEQVNTLDQCQDVIDNYKHLLPPYMEDKYLRRVKSNSVNLSSYPDFVRDHPYFFPWDMPDPRTFKWEL